MARRDVKVKLNRGEFGRDVMASASMRAHLARLGSQVAARTGGTVTTTVSPARGGGSRARAIVTTNVPMRREVETGEVLAAVRAVFPRGHRP